MNPRICAILSCPIQLLFVGSAQAAEPAPLTANVAITSNYVSRGFTQSWSQPAIQGGLDYALPHGAFVGTWMSSLSGREFRSGTIEWDLYGGWSTTAGPLNVTLAATYYAYPGSSSPLIDGRRYDFAEAKAGLGYGAFSATAYYTMTNDWFGTFSDGRGSTYLDLSLDPEIGAGLTLQLHAGFGNIRHHGEANWKDYKIGVSKSFEGGWSLALALTHADDRNAYWTGADFGADAGGAVPGIRLGKTALALTLSRSF